ncbi:MAG: bifunctional phosphoserine phosphatase/homoserine phosphotransferase ThrH, partial [Bacteroidales bacterium]|nr:bifunctional phosphoserine phosphatase/homoserine phosphotransferase ThrH [Bacteroidales bacterium]
MYIVCSDLEGVFVPEVWINVAEKTKIPELRLTTRDITDYDVLMKQRLEILAKHGLKLKDIQDVIGTIKPMDGANEFINWIKEITQLIIVSDTFAQFAEPLMKQLNRPTLFCHNLVVNDNDEIIDYTLGQKDPKRKVVQAL